MPEHLSQYSVLCSILDMVRSTGLNLLRIQRNTKTHSWLSARLKSSAARALLYCVWYLFGRFEWVIFLLQQSWGSLQFGRSIRPEPKKNVRYQNQSRIYRVFTVLLRVLVLRALYGVECNRLITYCLTYHFMFMVLWRSFNESRQLWSMFRYCGSIPDPESGPPQLHRNAFVGEFRINCEHH